jgi:putative sigma-54 modulation protein
MLLNLTIRGMATSDTLEGVIRRKLHFALDRFGEWVHRVQVAVDDLNGPKGGLDKRCRVTLSVPRRKPVVVEGRGADVLSVVATVIDRAALTLDRARSRKRAMRHVPSAPTAPDHVES